MRRLIKRVEYLVIGAGVIGSAITFHLAEAGQEVMAVDQAFPAWGTSGSTAAWVWVHSKTPGSFGRFSELSAELYPSFQTRLGTDIEYRRTGGLVPALTMEQVKKSQKLVKSQRGAGLEVYWLSREETLEKEPALSPQVLGASYSPLDGNVNPFRLLGALLRAAQRNGATFLTYNPVTGITLDRGKVTVQTKAGDIVAKKVVIAAGVYSRQIGRMVGVDIPVGPERGEVLITEPLQPLLRHTLAGMRQTVNGEVLIGYSQEKAGMDRRNTFDTLRETAAFGVQLVPALARATIVRTFAGLRCLPRDDLPILGPIPGVQGMYVAAMHSGYTLAPLIGTLMTELLTEGETSLPITPYLIDRFAESKPR